MNSIDMMGMDYGNESVGGSIGRGIDAIGGAIKAAAKKVWEFLKKVVTWIVNKIKALASKAKEIVTGAWAKLKSAVSAFCGFIKGKLTALWGWLLKMAQAAKNKASDALAAAKAKFNEIKDSIAGKLADAKQLRALKAAAKEQAKNGVIPADILTQLKDMTAQGADMASKIEKLEASDEIKGAITNALNLAKEVGTVAASVAEVSEGGGDTTSPTGSADSYMNVDMDAIAMARAAAKEGNIEGAIESLITAITGKSDEPSEEDIATENALLEMELLDY